MTLAVNHLVGFGAGDVPAAPGGPWSPANINTQIWFDVSDLDSLRQERTGAAATTPVAVGDVVGSIRNKGTAGGWFVAPTDAKRGVLTQDGGLFYIDTTGGDCYALANATLRSRFYFGCAQARNGTFFVEHGPNANSYDGFYLSSTVVRGWIVRRNPLGHGRNAANNWFGAEPGVVDFVYSSSVQQHYFNGVEGINTAFVSSLVDDTEVTDTLYVLSRANTTLFSQCRLYALATFNGELSAPDLASMRGWLGSKCGVTL